MKKRIGVIFIAVSFLPSILIADDRNGQTMPPQANQYDNRYMHPGYQRHQAYQQNTYQRQRPAMQRPTPPANFLKMQEQHKQRMAEQRKRMQQMRSQHSNRVTHECGHQKRVGNPQMRPQRPERPDAYRGYRGPRHSSAYSNRMNAPQRPVYQGAAHPAYRGYAARPDWNQYRLQARQQDPRRVYQPRYAQQAPMAAPRHRQAAHQPRAFYPRQAQQNPNWNRFGNMRRQNHIPAVAHQSDYRTMQPRQQTFQAMPVRGPYQSMRINQAAYTN